MFAMAYTEEEKQDKVASPPDIHRAITVTPLDNSGSSTSSSTVTRRSTSLSLSGKRAFELDNITTPPPPSSSSTTKHSPEASPDGAGDPNIDALLINSTPPFSEYLHIEKFLRQINENPPPDHNYQLIHAEKTRQKESLEQYITSMELEDLRFLSLYMNSIQVGNLTDYYFKTIRTECGSFGWFQTYGNTKTWQHIRSAIKDQIAMHLQRSDIPGRKIPVPEGFYNSYLQIFQQHSGRLNQIKSWLLPWLPWAKTRSEVEFTHNFSLDKTIPAIPLTSKKPVKRI
ncbi:MAG: hypothetical protein V4501_09785 [Pseudomonadota bacterium]